MENNTFIEIEESMGYKYCKRVFPFLDILTIGPREQSQSSGRGNVAGQPSGSTSWENRQRGEAEGERDFTQKRFKIK